MAKIFRLICILAALAALVLALSLPKSRLGNPPSKNGHLEKPLPKKHFSNKHIKPDKPVRPYEWGPIFNNPFHLYPYMDDWNAWQRINNPYQWYRPPTTGYEFKWTF